jgi:hypothetical protein
MLSRGRSNIDATRGLVSRCGIPTNWPTYPAHGTLRTALDVRVTLNERRPGVSDCSWRGGVCRFARAQGLETVAIFQMRLSVAVGTAYDHTGIVGSYLLGTFGNSESLALESCLAGSFPIQRPQTDMAGYWKGVRFSVRPIHCR